MTDLIEWDEPQPPMHYYLAKATDGHLDYATPADLLAAGYVPATAAKGEGASEWLDAKCGKEWDCSRMTSGKWFACVNASDTGEYGNTQWEANANLARSLGWTGSPAQEPVGYVSNSPGTWDARTIQREHDDYYTTPVFLAPQPSRVAELVPYINDNPSTGYPARTCGQCGWRCKGERMPCRNHHYANVHMLERGDSDPACVAFSEKNSRVAELERQTAR